MFRYQRRSAWWQGMRMSLLCQSRGVLESLANDPSASGLQRSCAEIVDEELGSVARRLFGFVVRPVTPRAQPQGWKTNHQCITSRQEKEEEFYSGHGGARLVLVDAVAESYIQKSSMTEMRMVGTGSWPRRCGPNVGAVSCATPMMLYACWASSTAVLGQLCRTAGVAEGQPI